MNEGSAPPIINWVLVSEEAPSSAVAVSSVASKSNKTKRTAKNPVIWWILTHFLLLNYLLSYHSKVNNGTSCWWLSIIFNISHLRTLICFLSGLAIVKRPSSYYKSECEKWQKENIVGAGVKFDNSQRNDPAVRVIRSVIWWWQSDRYKWCLTRSVLIRPLKTFET